MYFVNSVMIDISVHVLLIHYEILMRFELVGNNQVSLLNLDRSELYTFHRNA